MKITDVKVQKFIGEGNLLAFASITIDECFVVRSLRVMNSQNGPFVSMPARRRPDGEFFDIAHPITAEARDLIQKVVLEEYAKAA